MDQDQLMLKNIHLCLQDPPDCHYLHMVKGEYLYYHNMCDGVDDRGWGSGYRALQTVLSWIYYQYCVDESDMYDEIVANEIPSIAEVQELLINIGGKSRTFLGSNEIISCIESMYCIYWRFKISCQLIHMKTVSEANTINILKEHFSTLACPVMMGGKNDAAAKIIMGICENDAGGFLLVLDPHNSNPDISIEAMESEGWVRWVPMTAFDKTSFYNLCWPSMEQQ